MSAIEWPTHGPSGKTHAVIHAPLLRSLPTWIVLLLCGSPLSHGAPVQREPQTATELSEVAATKLREAYTEAETGIEVSPDGALVAVGHSGTGQDGRLDVWDAALGTKLYSLSLSWGVGSRFTFSRDSKKLAACTEYSAVTIHDARSGALERRIDTHDNVDCLVFPANTATLLTGHSSGDESTAALWSLDTGKQIRGFPHRVKPRRGYPDPKTASPQEIRRTLREIASAGARRPQHFEFMHALAVHPDRERMVTLGEDEGKDVLRVWSLSRGKLLRTPDVQGQRIQCIAFSPDGKYLAGGTLENTILIWETTDWSTVRTIGKRMPPTTNRVTGFTRFHQTTSVAFSPDSTRLASGHSGSGEIIRLWACATGDELASCPSSRDPRRYGAKALAFVNDGRVLLASGTDFVLAFFVGDGFVEPFPIVGLTRREEAQRLEAANSLISAVQEKDIERVRALLAGGTDPSHSGDNGMTALWQAAGTGELALVAALVHSGADVNGRSLGDSTPLWFAAQKGHLEIATLLCEHGADINAVDRFGGTALHWAAHFGHLETVKLLLEHGADVNAPREGGKTALSMARSNGHEEVVRILLAAGANDG